MTQINTCEDVAERVFELVNGTLSPDENIAIGGHLISCEACRAKVKQFRAIQGVLKETIGPAAMKPDFKARTGQKLEAVLGAPVGNEVFLDVEKHEPGFIDSLRERLSGAPWWGVSVVMHGLVIALGGLISMAVQVPQPEDAVIMITELAPRKQVVVAEEEKPAERVAAALHSKHEVPPTDPTSREVNQIVVPPEILAQAKLGDHFETVNPDRPDTQSAFGNPESQSFHSMRGSDDVEGGGGTGGVGLEDLIGIGGASTAGSGGGFGGGHGTGIGVGSGRGTGSFGQRNGGGRVLMVKKFGGSKATEGAVDIGLEWLARNQEADGHWDALKHGAKAGQWTKCQETLDVSDTGLALLAFLGAGHTEKVGKYKENVIRGLKYLKDRQNKETGAYAQYNYAHAIAGMAMAEAAGMARIKETMESAQKAVDCTTAKHKNYPSSERGGWSYSPEQHESVNGDMSNSGWAFMFLKSAKVAGLHVPVNSIEGVHRYLSACQRDKVKDPYPEHKYSYGPQEVYAKQDNRGYIAILGRLFFGTPAEEVESGARYMISLSGYPHSGLVADGAWKDGAGVNLYYFYYQTLICFQVGGQMWKEWNEKLRDALPKTQIKDAGANHGSWDPRGAFSEDWGRVGQTALSILCMEVYYRYQKLAQ